jgi:hypothetical protein
LPPVKVVPWKLSPRATSLNPHLRWRSIDAQFCVSTGKRGAPKERPPSGLSKNRSHEPECNEHTGREAEVVDEVGEKNSGQERQVLLRASRTRYLGECRITHDPHKIPVKLRDDPFEQDHAAENARDSKQQLRGCHAFTLMSVPLILGLWSHALPPSAATAGTANNAVE